MKYTITENRLKSVFDKYMDQFPLEIHDMGDDVTVFIENGDRLFDTFDDNLVVNPSFWEKLEGLFGENIESLLVEWFNNALELKVTTAEPSWDIYTDDDNDDEEY